MSLRCNTIASGAPHGGEGVLAASESTAEVCRALGRVLRDGIDIHRCQAAQALGRIDHPAGVRALVDALLDEDEDVRSDAAGALARLGPPEAGRQLLENLLGDPCTGVKLHAIEALTKMRHPELAPWLRRLLAGRDEEIVWDETEFYEGGWDDWIDVQVKAIQALAELGVEAAVPGIVAAIDDELGQDLSEVGFKALASLGAPGAEALSRYLSEGDARCRRRVAAALGDCDAEAARPALARALGDPSPDVRLAAARALAAREPTDPRLAALFSDPEPALRAEAVRLCGRHHPEHLAALLSAESPAVLAALFELLAVQPGLRRMAAVVQALRAGLADSDGDLAAAAAAALAALAPEDALEDLLAQLRDPTRPLAARLGAARALARLGGAQAAAALAEALGEDARQLRLEAMAGLAALALAEDAWPNRPGEVLLAALRGELVPAPEAEADAPEAVGAEATAPPSDEQAVSESAFPTSTLASILGDQAPRAAELEAGGRPVELTQADLDRLALAARSTGKRVVPVVPQVAPHEDVRRFAARVLGDLACDEVADSLAQALGADDVELCRTAADSLARIGDGIAAFSEEVTDALRQALIDADRDIRLSAIRALGAAGGAGTAKVLEAQLRDPDSFVRAETVRALARLGAAGPELAALLDDPDPGVRLAAAQALAGAGGPGAVERLADFAFAFEGYHRRAAGRLLRRLDMAAANAHFLQALDEPELLRLRPVAIEALEELNRTDGSAAD
jgi:HEAT repeat protein